MPASCMFGQMQANPTNAWHHLDLHIDAVHPIDTPIMLTDTLSATRKILFKLKDELFQSNF